VRVPLASRGGVVATGTGRPRSGSEAPGLVIGTEVLAPVLVGPGVAVGMLAGDARRRSRR